MREERQTGTGGGDALTRTRTHPHPHPAQFLLLSELHPKTTDLWICQKHQPPVNHLSVTCQSPVNHMSISCRPPVRYVNHMSPVSHLSVICPAGEGLALLQGPVWPGFPPGRCCYDVIGVPKTSKLSVSISCSSEETSGTSGLCTGLRSGEEAEQEAGTQLPAPPSTCQSSVHLSIIHPSISPKGGSAHLLSPVCR